MVHIAVLAHFHQHRVPAQRLDARGVLLRPVGSVVYFMPPYVITPEQIDLMVTVAAEGIGKATCD